MNAAAGLGRGRRKPVAYHDALSARDRDRLRQSVLESHGWDIHRLWSTDWFQRPQQEIARIIAAIEVAKAEDQGRDLRHTRPTVRITTEDEGEWTIFDLQTGDPAEKLFPRPTLRPPSPTRKRLFSTPVIIRASCTRPRVASLSLRSSRSPRSRARCISMRW